MSDNLNHVTGFQCGDTILAAHTKLNLAAVRMTNGTEVLIIEGERFTVPASFHHATQQVINIAHLGQRKGAEAMRELAAAIRAKHVEGR